MAKNNPNPKPCKSDHGAGNTPGQRRWMKSIMDEVEDFDVVLPWQHGADRKAWRQHLNDRQQAALPRPPQHHGGAGAFQVSPKSPS